MYHVQLQTEDAALNKMGDMFQKGVWDKYEQVTICHQVCCGGGGGHLPVEGIGLSPLLNTLFSQHCKSTHMRINT